MVDITPQWHELLRDTGARLSQTTASTWRGPTSPFMQQAAGLGKSLKEMRHFLVSNFNAYVDINRALPSMVSTMTERERDAIDAETEVFLLSCAQGIEALRVLLSQKQAQRDVENEDAYDFAAEITTSTTKGSSIAAHQHACVSSLLAGLKAVTAIAATAQSERRKLANEIKEGPSAYIHMLPHDRSWESSPSPAILLQAASPTPEELIEREYMHVTFPDVFAVDWGGLSADELRQTVEDAENKRTQKDVDPVLQVEDGVEESKVNFIKPSDVGDVPEKSRSLFARKVNKKPAADDMYRKNTSDSYDKDRGSSGVTSNQLQVLERENYELTEVLQGEVDQARKVEARMAEISRLMGVFAEKVVEQQAEMETALDAVVGAHEAVKSGTSHLDRATERGSTFKKFYVGYMLFMTFALLFLHLLND